MPDNAANRKSIRRKEKASRLADVQRREVITQLMSTEAGRHWMWDTLASCHIFATTFNGDPTQSAFMEGQRAAGLAMLSDIMAACPDQYIQAMRESNVRSTADEQRSSTESDGGDSGSTDPGDPADGAVQDIYGDGNYYDRDGYRVPH